MGYRSNVAYTIRFTSDDDTLNRQAFFTFIAEAKSNDSCRAALEDCDVDEQDLRINFTAEDIKWYDNIPIVEDHTALIDLAEETIEDNESECVGYIFIRTGENEDDNEVRAKGLYNFDWLWIRRTIERDW
jgi:hypothetical protein